MADLITPEEMIRHADDELGAAYRKLSDASDWLRSDWPSGMELTNAQVERLKMMRQGIAAAKAAIKSARW